jgi:four helix bundle protein
MARITRFEDLEAWQQARELTRRVYKESRTVLFSKDFGLRDQIRRATVSVMSNITEGYERGRDREFVQFLIVAKGSCGEVRAQLYVALDQGYLTEQDFEALVGQAERTSQLIAGLIRYLQRRTPNVKRPT